jgi:plasmid stability protein
MDKAVLGRNVPETLTRALHVLSRVSENLRFEAKDVAARQAGRSMEATRRQLLWATLIVLWEGEPYRATGGSAIGMLGGRRALRV